MGGIRILKITFPDQITAQSCCPDEILVPRELYRRMILGVKQYMLAVRTLDLHLGHKGSLIIKRHMEAARTNSIINQNLFVTHTCMASTCRKKNILS
jgi:hypothetical protein